MSPRDPLLWASIVVRALACILLGRYKEAIGYADKTRQFQVPYGYWPYATKASALAQLGRTDEARELIPQAVKEKPELSISYIHKTLPTSHEDGLQKYFEGLRKAGLPEE